MNRNEIADSKRNLERLLNQVDSVCASLTKINELLDQVDKHRTHVTQHAITAAKLLLKTVRQLGEEVQPEGPQAPPKLTVDSYQPNKYTST